MLSFLLIGFTVVVSFAAFQQPEWFDRLCGWPFRTNHYKEWWRLISGGFIHADVPHLFFNMVSFYFFGRVVEIYFTIYLPKIGAVGFVLFYLIAIVVANIPDMITHRDNYGYRSVGASGGVAAVLFASIIFDPWNRIGFFIPDLELPGIFFAPLYLALSFYMAKRGTDNIGHVAHITGAVFGFVFPLLIKPSLFNRFVELLFS
ncbi:MAG: rhomboid family intramembrane serine protease [Chitinophagales bacterium]